MKIFFCCASHCNICNQHFQVVDLDQSVVVAEVAEEAADVAADIYSPFASQEQIKLSINQRVAKVKCMLERCNMQPAFQGHFKGVTEVKCTLEWYFIVGI